MQPYRQQPKLRLEMPGGARTLARLLALMWVMQMGMAPACAQPVTSAPRTLNFPAGHSLGRVVDLNNPIEPTERYSISWWLGNPGANAGFIADARGDVTVPAGRRLGLIVTPQTPNDELTGLAAFKPNDLEFLGFDSQSPTPSDRCLAAVCSLTGLKTLFLPDSRITNEGLAALQRLPSLEHLSLTDGDINSTGIANIAKVRSLKALRLYTGTTFTVEQFALLSGMTSLQALFLSSNRAESEGLSHLCRLPRLEFLFFGAHECCGEGLHHLACMPALRHLQFYDLRGSGLAALPAMPHLRTLHIKYVGDAFTPGQMANLERLTGLEEISLTARYTDEGLAHLKPLQRLRRIHLAQNWQDCLSISDASLAHFASLPHLESLDIYIEGFTDEGLRHLSQLPRLRRLCIPNCRGLTDAGLEHLGRIRTLEELNIRSENVTDAGLRHLESLTSLTKLVLFPHSKATGEGLARLKARLPNLAYVDNMRFPSKAADSWTSTSAAAVRQSLPHLGSARYFVQDQRVVLSLMTVPNPSWLLQQDGRWPCHLRINGRDVRSQIPWEMGLSPTRSQQAFFDLTRAVAGSSETQQLLGPGQYSVALVLKDATMADRRSSFTVRLPELQTNLVEFDIVAEGTPDAVRLRAGDKYNGRTVPEWIRELAAHDGADRTAAVAQLASVGEPAVALLAKLIHDMDRRAPEAAQALIAMGELARGALPSLIKQAQRPRTPNRTVPDWDNELAIDTLARMTWARDEIIPVIRRIADDSKAAETTRACARRALNTLLRHEP